MKAGPARKRRAVVEEIEPRILYSADFAPALADAAAFAPAVEQRIVDPSGEFAQTSPQDAQARRHEIVFVDPATSDYAKLIEDIRANAGAERDIDVVLLDADQDGIKQISETLVARSDISVVHLISHGSDGAVQLGASTLNFDSLLNSATQIKGWSDALADDADLLIYGCDVAASDAGKSLVDALSRLTGADVAASEDTTGAASQGGDWTLEYQDGAVQTQLIFDQSMLGDWSGTLQAITSGGETRANTTTSGVQDATTTGLPRAVATDANGNFVVVWASNAAGQDGNGYGIYGQRFDAAGTKVGSEFRINNYTTGDQTQPSVAMDANGNFVVAWTSNGQDGSAFGVYAQRYDASATKVGGEFRVNTTTASDQFTPIVAMNATGNFVVMWTSSGQDGSGYGVFAKRYNASGVAQSGDLQINSNATGDQWPDGLVVDAGGNFIATFASSDPGGWGVYAARYDLGLNMVLPEVRVNTTTAGDQDNGAIAMDSSGNYVVVWRSSDTNGTGIYAQRYTASGTKIGGEFRVNSTIAGDQTRPEIAMDASGRFVVTWASYNQDAGGTWGIYQQEYYANGTANGGEVKVNTTTAGNQTNASVAMTATGDFVVAWSGQGTGDADGVFFQRYVSPGVTISQTSGLTTTEAGGTATFTVVLDKAPTSNVTISLASSDTTEGTLSASSLTFTTGNWNTAQTVTITGVDDAFGDGSIAYTIVTGAAVSLDSNYSGLPVADVSVTNSDTTPSEPARTINEDASQTFSFPGVNAVNVTDGTATDGTVRVQLTVTNGIFTLSQTTGLTFIAGANGSGTMTVQGLESNINAALNGSVYTPTANYNGSASLQVTTTRVPDVTAQYTFENSGSLGADAAGTYNGTVTNTTASVDATRGNVASMTGNGSVQVTGRFGNPANITLGAWVNLTTADTNGADVISLGDSVGIRLDGATGGVQGFMYNGTLWQNTRSSQYIAGTGWHHIAYTFDNTTKIATVYLDGTVVASATVTGSITYNQGANSYIGRHANGATTYDFNGKLDDVRVYNRALTATEIAALASDAKAPTQSVAITVTAVNDAPTRTAASVSLAAVNEDTANPAGATVSALFTSAFTDATDQVSGGSSANTLAGVAVTANAANSGAEGRWQWYNGSSWVDISTSVSSSSALVLASGTSVRFLPNADYSGTPGSLTVRLIDNSSGAVTSGTTVNVTTSGGTTQYSDASNAVTLTTSITAVNDAPVLSGANNLTAIGEDPASNPGTLVSALISGRVSDADGSALTGIAVTAVDNTNGTWQYSTNGGGAWTAFGSPSGASARLVAADANTYVRFVPNANWNGTVSPGITFRAWDQTSGTAGSTANTSTNGGSSAFSSATASAAVTVTAVNDAPTRTAASVSLAAVAEDTANPTGATVSALFTSAFSDATDQVTGGSSANTLAGVAVTANAANSGTEGRWQWYNGTSWVDISTSVSTSSALVLASGTSVRFLPNADYSGTPGSLTVRLIDNSSGAVTSGTTVNVTTSGGTTQYSDASNPVTLTTSVTAVNDAPVLSGANNLTAIGEDPSSNPGTLVSALISGRVSDADGSALTGIAVTAVDNTNGTWQYSTNGGGAWTAFGSPSGASARLLAADANTYVRFVPNANWNGTVSPGITFRAWDQTSGTAGNTADTSSSGGTTAFSSATASASITVNAVNDAPTRTAASVSLAAVAEDTANPTGATVSALFTSAFSDATDQVTGGSSANTLAGVAVTANAANSGTEGRWQWYNGSSWVDISTSVSTSSALVLASGTSVRFLPNADCNGTPGSLSVRLIDNSAGAVTSGTTVDVTTSGGTTQYSDASNPVTLTTSVTAVNDAPALTGANNLTAIGEDPVANPGTLVSALIAGQVSDVDSVATGIAVTAVDNANGAWQYSTNGGTTWNAFGSLTAASARLLTADANTYVRFVPNANWNGTVTPGITFRAWDQTSGSAGGTADTSTNGGTSAFSGATASAGITVNAVNDAPTNTVPAAQGTSQNTALVLSSGNGNQISIADVDAGGSPVQVTLTATNGTITLNGSGGLSFTTGDGAADATMTFTGTLANINAALNGLSFDPTTGFSGAALLTINTDDQGNTGSGGVQSANSTVDITVNAAIAPTAANDSYSVNEDASLTTSSVAGWDMAAWGYRAQLAIGNIAAGTQSNFPVLVQIDTATFGAGFYSQTQAAGQDLRFVDSDGTQLAYEIESWNPGGASYAWVNVPQLDTASGTDFIRMYWGNASAADAQTSGTVWNNSFSSVWHLDGDGVDSSSSGNTGTLNGGPAATTGKVGSAVTFDGVDDMVTTSVQYNNPTTYTIEGWFKTSTASGTKIIGFESNQTGTGSGSWDRQLYVGTDGKLYFGTTPTYAVSPGAVADNAWHYAVAVRDVAGGQDRLYLDGALVATSGLAPDANTTGYWRLGGYRTGFETNAGDGYFPGQIDEARVSTVARSTQWVAAQYASMNGTLLTAGAVQVRYGSGVLANDSDTNGDPLTAVLVSGPSNAASFTLSADGSFTYTPTANFNGTDTFTYLANDGINDSNLATVTITVNPVNDAPVGTDKTVTTLEDTGYTFTVADFGFNDPDDSPGNSLTAVKIATLPGVGSLTNNGVAVSAGQFVTLAEILAGDLQYSPAAGANGAAYATFTFQVQDDGGTASSGVDTDATARTITINVTPVNDAPVLTGANDLTAIDEDPLANPGTLVSALIAGQVSDVDSAATGIAVTAVDNTNGTWQYSTNGGSSWTAFGSPNTASARLLAADVDTYVRFVPNANWNGTVANGITFRAWDQTSGTAGSTADTGSNGGSSAFSSATASAAITVNALNDAPLIVSVPASYAATEQTPLDLAGSISITDLDADTGNIQTTLSVVSGILTATPGILGVTISGSGTDTVTLTGTLTNVFNLLQGNGGATLSYVIGSDAPAASDTLSVLVDDQGNSGLGGAKTATANITINVTAVNDAPTIANGATVSLSGTDEDSISSGTSVDTILSGAGWADVDSAPAKGIAVTAVSGNGTWQYSTNGIAWTNFGSVSGSSALLLDSATQVRYMPDGQNGETASFSFRAWDQTTGTASVNGIPSTADPGAGGNSSAYSAASASATIVVSAVNDAPALDNSGAMTLSSIDEDALSNSGDLVSAIIASAGGDRITDVDSGPVEGIAITALVSGNGTWQYSIDGGSSWSDVDAVSNSSALLLRATDRLRFVPDGLDADVASVSFRAWDQSGGAAGSKVDVSGNGGTSAFSSAIETASITVTAVNDAPVLAATVVTLDAVDEDAGAPVGAVGTLVSSLVGGVSDVDSGARGIAITAADITHGTWFYSTDDGASWSALGSPDAANSRLLAADAGTRIYFRPNADYNGTIAAALTFRAWDQSSGSNGATADTTTNGGTSAFSSDTANAAITVTAVNDPPVAVDDSASTDQNTVLSVPAGGVLSNDSDIDGDTLLVSAVEGSPGDVGNPITLPSGALLTLNADGSYSYDPNGQFDSLGEGQSATDTFAYTMSDGNGGSAPANVIITIDGRNDAPTLSNGATVGLSGTGEDTPSSGTTVDSILTDAGWADVDSGALKGIAVTAVSGNGTWRYSTDGSTWTDFGSVSSSAALLLDAATQVRYAPDGQNGETATFSFRAWDQSAESASADGSPSTANPGAGGGSSAYSTESASASIVVGAVNDAPSIGGVVAGQTVNDTATLNPFAAVIIGDVDNPAQILDVSVTLDDAAKGAFSTLNGFTNAGGGVYTFTGTAAAATTAIQGLVFDPADNRVTPGNTETTTFTISVDDGVAAPVNNSTTTVVSTSVNDASSISGTVGGQAVNDNATISPFAGVTIGDVDNPAQTLSVSVNLDLAAKGAFTTLNGFTDAGGGVYTFTGTAAAATTAIQGLVFDPADNRVVPGSTETTTFSISVDDGSGPVSDATTTVVSTSVNDAPSISGTVAGQAVNDNATISPFAGVTIGDVDNPAQTLSVSVSLDLAAKGAFTTLNGFTDAGGGLYTFNGTAAAATAAIQGLVFDPADNRVAPGSTETTTFTVSVDDGVAAPVNNSTTTVVSTSVNDAPTLSNGATVGLSGTNENTPSSATTVNAILTGSSWTDVDSGPLKGIAVTAVSGNGSWEYSTDGMTWTAFGAVSGSSALLLDAATQVRYVPDGQNGETADFSFRAWDQSAESASANGSPSTANPGAGGGSSAYSTESASAAIVVSAVNDAPSIGGAVAGQAVNDTGTLSPFAGVTLGDVDDPAQTLDVSVTLDVPAKGVFTPASLTASGFSDIGGGVYTFSGTAAAATTAIRGLVFDPADNRVMPGNTETTTFTISVDDGVAAPVTDSTTTVVSTSVNDAPSIGGAVAGQAVNDTATLNPFASVSIGDVDNPAQTLSVSVTLDVAAKGVFTPASLTASGFSDIGGGVYTFSGTAAAATAAIQGLVFDAADNRVTPGNTETTTFTISVDDGVAAPVTDSTTTVVSTSVNDAPTLSNGATVGLSGTNENTPSSATTVNAILTGSSWTDVDSGPLKGIAVTAVSGNGSWEYSTDGMTWTAFGAVSGSSALLLDAATQVRYVPDGQNGETADFSFRAWDQSAESASANGSPSTANPGAGGGSSAYSTESASAAIVVSAVNDAPSIGGAVAGQAVNDTGTISPFAAVTLGDVDNPAQTLTVSVALDVAAKGVFTPASLTASGFSDAGGGVYTFSGTAAAATTAIRGLVFDPADNRVTPGNTETTTFTISVNDGGGPVSDNTTTVVSTSVNDAPGIGGALAGQAVNDTATISPFAGVSLGDVDNPAQTLSVSVALDAAAKGTFTAASLTASGFSDAGGGVYTFSGTAAAATSAIHGLVFDPADNRVTPGNTETTTLTISVDDGVAAAVTDSTTTVVSTSVNDAPSIGGALAGQAVNDIATISPFAAVTLGDVDNPAQTLTVSVALDVAAKGVFTAASLTASGFSDAGGGVYTFSGTAAAATTAIRGLVFDPADNRVTPGNTETTTFTISVDDGVAAPVTDSTTTVVSTSVNDAPSIGGAVAGQAVNDTATLSPFASVSIGDVDNPAQTLTVSVALDVAAKGAFTAGSLIASGFSDAGGGVYTFSGTAAAATTAIRGLVFDPTDNRVTPGNTETTTFTVSVNDGSGPVSNNTTTVVATSVNDAPSISGTVAAQAVNDTATLNPFAAVTIGDVDNPAQTLDVSVTLDVPAKGVFTPASLTASGFVDFGGGVYTFSGTAAAATAAIQGLVFDPTDNRVTPGNTETTTFTISVDDGVAAAVTDSTTTVVSTSVNDAPSIGGAVAGQAVNDTATISPFAAVSIGDVDNPAQTLTVSVALDVAAKGVFTAASLTASGFSDIGGGVYTFSGTAAAATAAIQGLVFDPADNRVAPGSSETTTFTISVNDGSGPVSNTTTTVVSTSVNDAPSISGAVAAQAVNDTGTLNPFATVTVGDVDNPAQILSVSVTLDTAAKGVFTPASLTASGFSPAGAGVYTFSGTAAAATTAIRGLVFDPADNRVTPGNTETTTFTISVNDGGGPVSNNTTTVVSTSVNDAPSISGAVAAQAVNDTATLNPFAAVTVGDVDNPAQTLSVSVTLDTAAKGVFTPASLTASGFSPAGAGVYTFSGTAAAATTAIRGLVFDPADNRVTPGNTETTTFTISVNDGSGPVSDNTTTVVSTSVNDAPSVSGTLAGQAVNDIATISPFAAVTLGDVDNPAQTLTVSVALDVAAKGVFTAASLTASGFSDAGGGVYTFSGTAAAATTAIRGLVFDPADNRVTPGNTETTTFTISVDDGVAAPVSDSTTTVVSTSVNDAPVAMDDSGVTDEDTVLNVAALGVLGNDSDLDGGPLVVSAVEGNPAAVGNALLLGSGALLTLNADGSFGYDPNGAFEYLGAGESDVDTFTYEVSDGNGGLNTATVSITIDGVNDAPGGGDATVVIDEDGSYIFTPADFGFADADASDSLQGLRLVSLPGAGSLSLSGAGVGAGQLISAADLMLGNLVFTPAADANAAGYASFTFRVNDGTVDAPVANTLTIDVTPVNDAPSLTQAGAQNVNEDAGAQSVLGFASASPGGGADEAGQTLTYSVSNDNNALFSVQPGIDAAGNLTYTLAADASGVANVTVLVSDNGGTANGGADTSAAQLFTITVNAVNDAPTLTIGANQSVAEDAGAQSVAGFAAAAPGGGADEAGQVLGYVVSNDNNALFALQPSLDAAGNLVYTPAPNASGVANVTVLVGDNGGTANGGVDSSAAQIFTITVNPVNDAPLLGANVLSIGQGGAVVLGAANLSASDVDDPAGGLMFSVSSVLHGRFELVSAPGAAIAGFSQADLTAGLVRFVHDGSGNAAAYAVSVSDGLLSDGPQAASITFTRSAVLVVPPAPVPVPVVNPPAPAVAPAPAPEREAPAGARARVTAAVFSPGRVDPPEAQLNDYQAQAVGFRRLIQPVATLNHFTPGPHIDPTLQLLAAAPANLEYLSTVPVDWSSGPAFPDAEETPRDRIDVLLEQVQLGGMALSVGVVWWASRISGLLGSLLASAPAWRHIDPLPVVGRDEDEEKKWYDPNARDVDADELAIDDVFEGARAGGGSASREQ